MNDEQQALAERVVACPGWRWMRGMGCLPDDDGYAARILHVGPGASTSETADSYEGGGIITRGCIRAGSLPDLTDPATLGCLLALVREAWGDGATSRCTDADNAFPELRWYVETMRGYPTDYNSTTEAEALVSALEAAGGG